MNGGGIIAWLWGVISSTGDKIEFQCWAALEEKPLMSSSI